MTETADPMAPLSRLTSGQDGMARWVVIGAVLHELEAGGAADPAGVPWLRRVADELAKTPSGIGANQLRKIQRVYNFVARVMQTGELRADWHNIPEESLSVLEVIKRLYDVTPAAGLEQLSKALVGQLSYTDILRIYAKEKAHNLKRLDGKRQSIALGNRWSYIVVDILTRNNDAFFGLNKLVSARRKRRIAGHFGITVDVVAEVAVGAAKPETDGFECLVFQSQIEWRQWPRHRMRTALYATFFRRYWLMVAAERSLIEEVKQDIITLRIRNVGVAIIAGTEDAVRYEILLMPSGEPEPDRRDLLAVTVGS